MLGSALAVRKKRKIWLAFGVGLGSLADVGFAYTRCAPLRESLEATQRSMWSKYEQSQ